MARKIRNLNQAVKKQVIELVGNFSFPSSSNGDNKRMKHITIITGANSGIGFEFARQLFNKNMGNEESEFWLIARNYEKLEEAKNKILSQDCASAVRNFPEIKTISMDISGSAGVERFKDLVLREKAAREYDIDTLVNNAGFGTYGPFAETPVEKEMSMIDLNCTSLTGLCGVALPYMTRGSKIINVASLASFLPLGNFAVYAATKSYVLSFTVALAAELKERGIKVSALCPGSVSTDFANVASNGARKEVLHGKSPEKVVAHCLKKAGSGSHNIVLWSAKWKCTAFLSRFVGRYAGARFTYLFSKRPYKHD